MRYIFTASGFCFLLSCNLAFASDVCCVFPALSHRELTISKPRAQITLKAILMVIASLRLLTDDTAGNVKCLVLQSQMEALLFNKYP